MHIFRTQYVLFFISVAARTAIKRRVWPLERLQNKFSGRWSGCRNKAVTCSSCTLDNKRLIRFVYLLLYVHTVYESLVEN